MDDPRPTDERARSPRSGYLPTILALIAALHVSTVGPTAEPAPGRDPFIVGACTHFGQGKGQIELNLHRAQLAGITSIRDEISWASVERRRGTLAVPDDRRGFFRAAAEQGIAPLLILDYGNRFYDDGRHPRSDEAIEGFCRYAEHMVRELGDHVRMVEVWNEWDIGIGLPSRERGSATDYVRLLGAVYPRIRAVREDVTVLGAGGPTSGGIERGWLEEAVEEGALRSCDVLSIHSYNHSRPGTRGGPEAWADWVRGVETMLRRHSGGRDVPLCITEMGWPSDVGKRGRDPETCAAYLARMYLLARTMPWIRGIWWYDLQDDGWDRKEREHNFGLLRADLTPKPAWHALRDTAPIVAHATYAGDVHVAAEAGAAAHPLRTLRFRLRDRSEVIAVWSADDREHQVVFEHPGGRPPGEVTLHPVGRRPARAPWGHRAWTGRRREPHRADRLSIVVDGMPWLVSGDVEGARVVLVTPRAAPETEPTAP